MPRVNVEESFFSSSAVQHISHLTGWEPPTVIGAIVSLWHGSQSRKMTHCTGDEILFFSRVSHLKGTLSYLKGLCESFLVKQENDLFFIVGNKKHILAVEKMKEGGKKGGRKKKATQLESLGLGDDAKPYPNPTLEVPSLYNTITVTNTVSETETEKLRNSSSFSDDLETRSIGSENILKNGVDKNLNVCNSEQAHQTSQITTKSKTKSVPDSRATREVYNEFYKKRYGVEALINARTNSQLSQFVKAVGVEDAPEIARFYLHHNDAFYLKSTHSVGLMLRDAEKLRTEWLSGRKVTYQEARKAEERDGYNSLIQKLQKTIEEKQDAEVNRNSAISSENSEGDQRANG